MSWDSRAIIHLACRNGRSYISWREVNFIWFIRQTKIHLLHKLHLSKKTDIIFAVNCFPTLFFNKPKLSVVNSFFMGFTCQTHISIYIENGPPTLFRGAYLPNWHYVHRELSPNSFSLGLSLKHTDITLMENCLPTKFHGVYLSSTQTSCWQRSELQACFMRSIFTRNIIFTQNYSPAKFHGNLKHRDLIYAKKCSPKQLNGILPSKRQT